MKFRRPKYGNRKTRGKDSRKEANRADALRLMQRAGEIRNLREQVKFELIPAQYATVDGKRRCVERAVAYMADFTYDRVEPYGFVVEDVKSPVSRTKDYIIKRKLMLYVHGLHVSEV